MHLDYSVCDFLNLYRLHFEIYVNHYANHLVAVEASYQTVAALYTLSLLVTGIVILIAGNSFCCCQR